MLSGLVVSLLTIDGTADPLKKFIAVGTIIEGGLIFVGAVWFAWISKILQLSVSNRFVLLVLVFCMPSNLLFSGVWGMYAEFGLLSMPLGLTLVAGFRGNKKAIQVGGVACGVMAANFYPSVAIPAVFFLTLLWHAYPSRRFSNNQLSMISKFNSTKLLVALLGVCVAGWAFGVHFSGLPDTGTGEHYGIQEPGEGVSVLWIVICALFLWALASYGLILICRWDDRLVLFATWGILAFIVANGYHLPWYFHGLFDAMSRTSDLVVNIKRLFLHVNSYPWLAVFWLCYSSLLLLIVYPRILRQSFSWVRRDTQAIVLFSFLSMSVIAIIGAAELVPYPLAPRTQYLNAVRSQGEATRIMAFTLPALSAGCVVFFLFLRGVWLSAWKFTLIALSVYSLAVFYQAYSLEISDERDSGVPLDSVINRFLAKEKDGVVVCVAEAFSSHYCMVGFAYNRYRSEKSARSLPTEILFDGRVINLNMRENASFESHIPLMSGIGPYLIITEGGGYRSAMIDYFREENRKITPIWLWRDQHVSEVMGTISPGDSFLVSRRSIPLSHSGVVARYRGKSTEEWSREGNFPMAKKTYESGAGEASWTIPIERFWRWYIGVEGTTSFRDTTVTVPWLEEGKRVIDLGDKSGPRPNLTP
jgi:hypothetical protein